MTVSQTLLFLDDRGGFDGCWSGVLLVTASLDLCSSDVFLVVGPGCGFWGGNPRGGAFSHRITGPNTACHCAVASITRLGCVCRRPRSLLGRISLHSPHPRAGRHTPSLRDVCMNYLGSAPRVDSWLCLFFYTNICLSQCGLMGAGVTAGTVLVAASWPRGAMRAWRVLLWPPGGRQGGGSLCPLPARTEEEPGLDPQAQTHCPVARPGYRLSLTSLYLWSFWGTHGTFCLVSGDQGGALISLHGSSVLDRAAKLRWGRFCFVSLLTSLPSRDSVPR